MKVLLKTKSQERQSHFKNANKKKEDPFQRVFPFVLVIVKFILFNTKEIVCSLEMESD